MSSSPVKRNLRRSSVNSVSSPATGKLPRVTPRNSGVEETLHRPVETPYTNLRQLAGLIQKPTTPQWRTPSVGSQSAAKSVHRTPLAQLRTPGAPGSGLRQIQSRRTVATTPHAIRALAQRRAGATPGRDRRRSVRGPGRETPRDFLRALSGLLAHKSERIVPSPATEPRRRSRVPDDEDDEPLPKMPRLSMPLNDEDEDDSFLLMAPRLSLPPEEDDTLMSVELPRRAMSEQPRYSGSSFGRLSFGKEVGLTGVYEDDEPTELVDESTIYPPLGDESMVIEDDTPVPRNMFIPEIESRRSSAVTQGDIPEGDESTFVFNVASRRVLSPSPEIEAELEEEDEENDAAAIAAEAEDDEDDVADIAAEAEESEEEAPIFNADDEDLELDEPEEVMSPPQRYTAPDDPLSDLDDTMEPTVQLPKKTNPGTKAPRKKTAPKVSRHGMTYPSLPPGVVRQLVTAVTKQRGKRATISKDTLNTIMQATDLFFEQVGDDLGAYASHARKKTIDESDVIALMRRQRLLTAATTPFSLAQKHLPRELLQDVRMPLPRKLKGQRGLRQIDEEEDEE